jgi:hypothetical protein
MSQCPCGLTFEILSKHNLVGPGGVCTAYYADKSVNDDGTRRVCGEDLLDHPYAPGKNILLPSPPLGRSILVSSLNVFLFS